MGYEIRHDNPGKENDYSEREQKRKAVQGVEVEPVILINKFNSVEVKRENVVQIKDFRCPHNKYDEHIRNVGVTQN